MRYSILQKGTGKVKWKRLDICLVSCGRRDLVIRFHIKGNQKRKKKEKLYLPGRKPRNQKNSKSLLRMYLQVPSSFSSDA